MSQHPLIVEDIPTELWYKIISHLEPPDVLFFSQVCRALHGTLSQKNVWIMILCSVCREHSIFQQSYPVDDMDLTHLQRAALGPYRWGALMDAHAGDTGSSLLQPMSKKSHKLSDRPCSTYFLVPGGRFLFTFHNRLLNLWDLGAPGKAPLDEPLLVSRMEIEAGTRGDGNELLESDIAVCMVGDGKLRIAFVGWDSIARVFDIEPGSKDPSFQELATLNPQQIHSSRFWDTLIHGNNLLFRSMGLHGFLWNLKTGRSLIWPLNDDANVNLARDSDILFIGDYLIEFANNDIKVWPTPSMDTQSLQAESSAHPPRIVLQYPFEISGGYRTERLLPSQWACSSDKPILFDMFIHAVGGAMPTSAARCALSIKPSPVPNAQPDITLDVLTTFTFPDSRFIPVPERMNTRIEFGWNSTAIVRTIDLSGEDYGSFIYNVSVPAEPKAQPLAHNPVGGIVVRDDGNVPLTSVVRLTAIHDIDYRVVCSVSGRVVHMESLEDDGSTNFFQRPTKLAVNDYLESV